MTTSSTASHELPSTAPVAPSQGRASQSAPERDGSAWTARLQRVREVLSGAVRGTWTAPQSTDASPVTAAVTAVATDSPPAPEPRVHREEDRTTRVYQRTAIESAATPLLVGGELPREEVSTTCRLPSAQLEALLLQLQYEAAAQAAATPAPPEPTSAAEMEVSSITFEELDAFRRSLVDTRAEPDEEVLSPPTAPSAPPPALAAEAAPGSVLHRLQSAKELTLRWGGALAARCVLRLRYLALGMMATIVKLRTRRDRPVLPVPVAEDSRTEATQDAAE